MHFASLKSTHEVKSIAVDATCGNGFDTEFLCRLRFTNVVGFDIQARAIKATQHRLEQANINANHYELHLSCHTQIADKVVGKIDCAMFNLGYLPRGDKTVTTQASETILALQQTQWKLSDTGLISLLCYPGHATGAIETRAVEKHLAKLPNHWAVTQYLSNSPSQTSPKLYLIKRQF